MIEEKTDKSVILNNKAKDQEKSNVLLSTKPFTESIPKKINKVFIADNPSIKTNNPSKSSQTKSHIESRIEKLEFDLINIAKTIPYIKNDKARETILDRGLLLSKCINTLVQKYKINLKDLVKEKMRMNKNNTALFEKEYLQQDYWTSRKKDSYILSEERKLYPVEFWYDLTGHEFSDEFHKNGQLVKSDFKKEYKKLFSK